MNTETGERVAARLFFAVFLVFLLGLWLCRALGVSRELCFALSLFLVLVAPGFLPSLRIAGKLGLSFLEVLPFSVSLSLAQATLLLLAFAWLGLSLLYAAWILLISTFAWYAWIELTSARRHGFGSFSGGGLSEPASDNRASAYLSAALLFFLVCVSILLLKVGAPIQWSTDSPAHLAAIRGVIEENRVFPRMEPYGPNGVTGPDLRFGIFHALSGLLLLLSGVKIQVLWKSLPAFFSPLLALGFFSVTRSLTGKFKTALVVAFLFPICYGGLGETLRITGYPTRVSMLAYLVALSVLFRYVRGQGRWLLLLVGVLVATVSSVHVYYFIEFVFVVTCFFLVKLLISRGERFRTFVSWAQIMGVSIGLSIPYLLYKFFVSYSTANQYSVENQGLLYLDGRLYILNPLVAYGWLGLTGLASLVLLPYFIKRARKSEGHAFVAAAASGTLLVIFNPLVMPIASKLLSYLAWRLMWAVPYILSIGIFVSEFSDEIRSRSPRSRILSSAGLVLVVAALLGTLSFRVSFYKRALDGGRTSFSDDFSTMSGSFERLDREIEGRKVFLSDPVTAYAIPAFTRHFVTAIPVAHSAPSDSFPVSRVRDAVDVLNPYVDRQRTIEVLRKYRVDYVVVNTRFIEKLRAFEYEIDPAFQERALEKISSAPELFREIFSEKGLHLFKVNNLEFAEGRASTRTPSRPTSGAGEESRPVADFSGLFTLQKVQLLSPSVFLGDTISIVFHWKCISPLPREDVFMLFVRADTDFPKGKFFSPAIEKPYRKFLERRCGMKFRIRQDFDPEQCEPPLHLWNAGDSVVQVVSLRVPPNSAPGKYTLKANLMRIPVSVNLRVSDYLRDEDYYSGVTIGDLIVDANRPGPVTP